MRYYIDRDDPYVIVGLIPEEEATTHQVQWAAPVEIPDELVQRFNEARDTFDQVMDEIEILATGEWMRRTK